MIAKRAGATLALLLASAASAQTMPPDRAEPPAPPADTAVQSEPVPQRTEPAAPPAPDAGEGDRERADDRAKADRPQDARTPPPQTR